MVDLVDVYSKLLKGDMEPEEASEIIKSKDIQNRINFILHKYEGSISSYGTSFLLPHK